MFCLSCVLLSYQAQDAHKLSVTFTNDTGACVCSIRTVLLLSPDEDIPQEVQSVSEQLSSTKQSNRDVTITLILQGFQSALGTKYDLNELRVALQVNNQHQVPLCGCTVLSFMCLLLIMFLLHIHTYIYNPNPNPKTNSAIILQAKKSEELEQLLEVMADSMEKAASTADLSTAKQGLQRSMERLRESLTVPASADSRSYTGRRENTNLKCQG